MPRRLKKQLPNHRLKVLLTLLLMGIVFAQFSRAEPPYPLKLNDLPILPPPQTNGLTIPTLSKDQNQSLILDSKELEIHQYDNPMIIPQTKYPIGAIDEKRNRLSSSNQDNYNPFIPRNKEIDPADSLLIDANLPVLSEVWTVDDVFDPPQILVIPEFGGQVISTYGAGNAIAVDPLFRRAQGLGIAPDWYGVGVSWAGAVGNLISNGRNIGITNFGIAINNEEEPSHFAPFIGLTTSVAISYDSDPPNTIKPTNILLRTMAGMIMHYENSAGEWLQLRVAYAHDISGTKPYEAYIPRFVWDQSKSNGLIIDLDSGIDVGWLITGAAINPHFSYDTIGGTGVLQKFERSSRVFTVNLRWRM
ncbi:MAG: hypothetical protein QM523_05620 [Candidatus Pacebacteria bacterium]|nr:hypothetical protein [Candidatus Paceibacterota bacterium]